jgi:hypothetical protein
MTEQLINALLGVLTTIIGGIFGFALSEITTRRREARTQAAQARSVRLIVGLEIDRNIAALREMWQNVKTTADGQERYDRDRRDLMQMFVDGPSLPFSRESLNSQLQVLPSALPHDTLTRLFAFYDGLGKVDTIRKEMLSAQSDQQAEMSKFRASQTPPGAPPGILYPPRTPFDNKAAQVWDGLENLVNGLLANGNPLAESAEKRP